MTLIAGMLIRIVVEMQIIGIAMCLKESALNVQIIVIVEQGFALQKESVK